MHSPLKPAHQQLSPFAPRKDVLSRSERRQCDSYFGGEPYAESVPEQPAKPDVTTENDPHCVAKLKDDRSQMLLAQEARKPMYFLMSTDGALGAQTDADAEACNDFKAVARKIAAKTGIQTP